MVVYYNFHSSVRPNRHTVEQVGADLRSQVVQFGKAPIFLNKDAVVGGQIAYPLFHRVLCPVYFFLSLCKGSFLFIVRACLKSSE